jgi:hypothetical protein
MRCAKCNAEGLEKLPPNSFSRNPGYRCPRCEAVMRPHGSAALYVIAAVLGVAFITLGITLAVAMEGDRRRAWMAGAGAFGLGAAAAGWAVAQLRLPTPIRDDQ